MRTQPPEDADESVITITESDEWLVIHDEGTGVTTQGEARESGRTSRQRNREQVGVGDACVPLAGPLPR